MTPLAQLRRVLEIQNADQFARMLKMDSQYLRQLESSKKRGRGLSEPLINQLSEGFGLSPKALRAGQLLMLGDLPATKERIEQWQAFALDQPTYDDLTKGAEYLARILFSAAGRHKDKRAWKRLCFLFDHFVAQAVDDLELEEAVNDLVSSEELRRSFRACNAAISNMVKKAPGVLQEWEKIGRRFPPMEEFECEIVTRHIPRPLLVVTAEGDRSRWRIGGKVPMDILTIHHERLRKPFVTKPIVKIMPKRSKAGS